MSALTLSLARCESWAAKGGKSSATWSKTLDGRLLVKGINPVEAKSFSEFGPLYFLYLDRVYSQALPSCLSKILGVFKVEWPDSRSLTPTPGVTGPSNTSWLWKISSITRRSIGYST
jgi:hypothetical protein